MSMKLSDVKRPESTRIPGYIDNRLKEEFYEKVKSWNYRHR